MLADSHTHLEFPQFDPDREQVFERAFASGVQYLLAIGSGTGPHRLRAGLEIAEGRPGVWATIGIHPHEARLAREEYFAELARLAAEPRVVAMGEIGLDYHYDHSPRKAQQDVFLRQLALAREQRLPIILHCREAWPDCLETLEQHWKATGLGGIFHCFSGSYPDARRGMDMGFSISFAGNVTFPKAAELREVARQIPPEQLLIETDSPFLSPVPQRGRRNEPAYVRHVAEHLAHLRGLPAEEIAECTTRNFLEFVRRREPAPLPGEEKG
ncbi:MAG: TatD family hydrolase [Acidobacteria bacterium]|nr:TatD family hydrolase [Acidobacteriota bacterium]